MPDTISQWMRDAAERIGAYHGYGGSYLEDYAERVARIIAEEYAKGTRRQSTALVTCETCEGNGYYVVRVDATNGAITAMHYCSRCNGSGRIGA